MKKSCSPSLGLALSLIGASLTFTAFAGGTPTLTEQFNTADADTSGGLTLEEFASWQRAVDRSGMQGLRVTRIQHYRDLYERQLKY